MRRERHARPESVGSTQQRADVPWIGNAPEGEHDVSHACGQIRPPVDADDAWGLAERRDLSQELGYDVLPRDEQLDRRDACRRSSLDEILALADRILVIYEGRIVGEVAAATATVEELGLLMAGGDQAS